jgi:hypothetical protein
VPTDRYAPRMPSTPGSPASSALPADEVELLACRLLAQNALVALRGPMSRGAVPAKTLAEKLGRPRNTLTRLITRSLGSARAMPFDLTARRTFDADRNGHQELWETALRAYQEGAATFGDIAGDDPDVQRKVISEMLAMSFAYQATSDFRLVLVNSHLLRAAALACDPGSLEPAAAEAREMILELSRESYERSKSLYTSALRLVLRGSLRRARSGYRDEDIVVALHSLYDGYMERHLSDSPAYPIRLLVDMLWDLAVAMTEPGFLQEPGGSDSLRAELLGSLLAAVRVTGAVPTVEEAAADAGIDAKVAKALFPDQDRLAEMCLDFALAGTAELRELAVGVRGTGLATLEALLRSVGEVSDVYRPLVEVSREAAVWGEMRALVERMLAAAGEEICAVDRAAGAEILVRAAMRGSDGETEWKTALEMLRASPAPQDRRPG